MGGKEIMIRAFEVTGSGFCVASDDGQKVHDQVAAALRADAKVTVSFQNVKSLTSAFLNAALGQLYGEFPEEKLKNHMSVSDMAPDDLALLKQVVNTAKQYFSDPERIKAARKEVLGADDDR